MIMISAMVMPDHNIATTRWDIVPERSLVSDQVDYLLCSLILRPPLHLLTRAQNKANNIFPHYYHHQTNPHEINLS